MKKLLALILAVIMIFSLAACGKEKKAEKYCFNCGEGISKNVAFCEHCGANVKENGGESTSSNATTSSTPTTSTPTTSSTPATSRTPTTSSKPTTSSATTASSKPTASSTSSTPTHAHSYSKKVTAATCKNKGYTTYTCSCGDSYVSDHTNTVSHSYSKYVCTMCGMVDKSHSYEYLVEWVKSNGTQKDGKIEYIFEGKNTPSKCFGLTYSHATNDLNVWNYDATNAYSAYTAIYLNDYYYGFAYAEERIYGYINASTYTENSSLTYKTSNCTVLSPNQLLPAAKSSINLILVYLESFLYYENIGITLYDLGFKAF